MATDADLAIISAQLGRPARGGNAVAARCGFGLPTVVRVDPRLDDGTPFPTVLWLSCPKLNSELGGLESNHAMVEVNAELEGDPEMKAAYAAGSERYVALRDELGEPLQGNPTAGGMPTHTKCLHVAAGHTLATGDNPVGRWALERALPLACDAPCVDLADQDQADAS